jgi:hypothetical protein
MISGTNIGQSKNFSPRYSSGGSGGKDEDTEEFFNPDAMATQAQPAHVSSQN